MLFALEGHSVFHVSATSELTALERACLL